MEDSKILRGRYKLINEISRGGMGAVYLANDLLRGCQVAVKKSFYSGHVQSKHGFELEAKLLARLDHAGLPKVTDYFVSDGKVQTLVMDFVPGETLEGILESGKHRLGCAIDPAAAMSWALQILEIMRYLHNFKPPVIHRDIKPNNIKLTESGRVMLLDFGLAKGSAETVIGGMSGYSPIEQVNRSGTDRRSDIYSLGTSLFHLLTNRYPMTALDRFRHVFGTSDAGQSRRADPQESVVEINPSVPVETSDVVMKAMSLLPENRFQSAEDMRTAIIALREELWLNTDGFHTATSKGLESGRAEPVIVDDEESLGEWRETQHDQLDRASEARYSTGRSTPLSAPSISVDVSEVPMQFANGEPAVTVASFVSAASSNVGNPDFSPRSGELPGFSTEPGTSKKPNTNRDEIADKTFARRSVFRVSFATVMIFVAVSVLAIALFQTVRFQSPDPLPLQFESTASSTIKASERGIEEQIGISRYLVRTNNKLVPIGDEYRFGIDEKFKIGVLPPTDGFLYVVSRDSNQNASLAYPSQSQTLENAVRKNVETVFPQNAAFQLRENSPAEMWVYFVVLPSRQEELAKQILTTLKSDQESNLSAPEISELFASLDELAASQSGAGDVRVQRIMVERR